MYTEFALQTPPESVQDSATGTGNSNLITLTADAQRGGSAAETFSLFLPASVSVVRLAFPVPSAPF